MIHEHFKSKIIHIIYFIYCFNLYWLLIVGFICCRVMFSTTIHKHPLFMTHSCRTTFRLLTHVSLLQYSISSNVLSFRRTWAHISAGYPCINSSWTHWVKNNNRPNYSQELKRVLAWPSSHYSNYPWSFFVFMGNLVTHDVVAILIYFWFIYTLFFYINLKDVCVNVV